MLSQLQPKTPSKQQNLRPQVTPIPKPLDFFHSPGAFTTSDGETSDTSEDTDISYTNTSFNNSTIANANAELIFSRKIARMWGEVNLHATSIPNTPQTTIISGQSFSCPDKRSTTTILSLCRCYQYPRHPRASSITRDQFSHWSRDMRVPRILPPQLRAYGISVVNIIYQWARSVGQWGWQTNENEVEHNRFHTQSQGAKKQNVCLWTDSVQHSTAQHGNPLNAIHRGG